VADVAQGGLHPQLLLDLARGDLDLASAVALQVEPGGPTHYAHATLRFAGGLIADLSASRIAQARVRTLEVTLPGAHLTADYEQRSVTVGRWDAAAADTRRERLPVHACEPLTAELVAFLDAILLGRPPEVGLDAAVRCMEVVEAIRAGQKLLLRHPDDAEPPAAAAAI